MRARPLGRVSAWLSSEFRCRHRSRPSLSNPPPPTTPLPPPPAPAPRGACAFHRAHSLSDDYPGGVLDVEEGKPIAHPLGERKAVILRNHGLLPVGHTVDEAAFWFIAMDRTCQSQLLAEAAG